MKSYIITFAILLTISRAAIDSDLVENMPEWPESVNFTMYSGLLNLSYTDQKAIHYVFITKAGETSTKNSAPVVLWLNGGPGCSSLDGFLSENGPFVLEDGMLKLNGTFNAWSWNNVANILYFESPAGVGFSPTETPFTSDYYNDYVTTQDNWEALKTFFNGFPELAKNDFWITGESYAGIYIPWLAAFIDGENKNGSQYINLKGIMVGDGVIGVDIPVLFNNTVTNYVNHHLISIDAYNTFYKCCVEGSFDSKACQLTIQGITAALYGINPYNIYAYCYPPYSQVWGCYTNGAEIDA